MCSSIARSSLKVHSWKKIVRRTEPQVFRENVQQEEFAPIKLVKQPYWSKAHHCAFARKTERYEKNFQIHHVTSILNNVSLFESFCSFKVRCLTAIKKASRLFLFQLFIGADIRTFHWKTWSWYWKRCLLVLNLCLDFHAHSTE